MAGRDQRLEALATLTAREQFEALWPRLQMAEGIYQEWPQVLHVRIMFGDWDERFLMLEMKSLDTWGFAQSQRPNPSCGASWAQLRCIESVLGCRNWSLHFEPELVRALIQRAQVTGTARWNRAQYQVLSDFIVDWELDRASEDGTPE